MDHVIRARRGVPPRRVERAANDFVARPASPRPLAALRIALTGVLLLQAWACSGSLAELYGSLGIVQRPITDALIPSGVPRLTWVVDALAPYGVTEASCIRGVFLGYVASLAGLLLGWRTRGMAACAWLTHLALKAGSNLTVYGVDEFAHIGLFYCVWMPVGHAWSLDRRAGRASAAPSAAARLSLRVLQLHLCLVYLSSGLLKASGDQWWSGEAIWRVLMRSDFNQHHCDFTWLAEVPLLAQLGSWGTLLVEIGYAFFIWPRRTRRPWALATVGLHLGIAVAMGLWAFSAVMIGLTWSAFLVSAEPPPVGTVEPGSPGRSMR